MHSAPIALTLAFAAVAALGGALPEPGRPDGPTNEPPLRARVTLGGESVDVILGEPGRAPDGRPLRVELLPTRAFVVDGSLAFDYPREWSFIGSVGVPTAVDAWWSLHGEGALIHLRRHGLEADEVLEQYLANLESMGGTPRQPIERRFGDRRLAGFAVELDVGQVRGGSRRWVQEVFAWEEAEEVAWMLALQRDVTPPSPLPDPGWIVVTPPTDAEGEPAAPALPEMDAVLSSWRW